MGRSINTTARKPYPTAVSDDKWALVAPYLALLPEDASSGATSCARSGSAVRWIVRARALWRLLPTNFPP